MLDPKRHVEDYARVKRLTGNRLLFLGALFSALLGSSSAEGLSLCIGPDSHVALEVAGAACCLQDQSASSAIALGRAWQDCSGCQDTPLSVGIGLTTHPVPTAFVSAPHVTAACSPVVYASAIARAAVPQIHEFRPPWDGLSSSTLRC